MAYATTTDIPVSKSRAEIEEMLTKAGNTRYRPVTSLTLANGKTVSLNDKVEDVTSDIGAGIELPVITNTNVHRRKYEDQGLEVLFSDRVLAIRLRGRNAVPLTLQSSGIGQRGSQIRVGMNLKELETTLGGDALTWDTRSGSSRSVIYRFYPTLGIGARLNEQNVVTEILVAQLPRER